MTISILALKGKLDGKILLLRFFFCRVYFKGAGGADDVHRLPLSYVRIPVVLAVWYLSFTVLPVYD